MFLIKITAVLLLSACICQPAVSQFIDQSQFAAIAKTNNLIFSGQIIALSESNIGYPANYTTALIKVNLILKKPHKASLNKKDTLTAIFKNIPSDTLAGDENLFSGNIVYYGGHLGSKINAVYNSTFQTLKAFNEFLEHLPIESDQNTVFAGEVTSIEESNDEKLSSREFKLKRAHVKVLKYYNDSLEKKKKVEILFLSEKPVGFSDAPVLKEGQSSIFVLSQQSSIFFQTNEFVVFDPQDVRPLSDSLFINIKK